VLKARAANSQFMEGHPWTGVSPLAGSCWLFASSL
jgi:hypothetical protein